MSFSLVITASLVMMLDAERVKWQRFHPGERPEVRWVVRVCAQGWPRRDETSHVVADYLVGELIYL